MKKEVFLPKSANTLLNPKIIQKSTLLKNNAYIFESEQMQQILEIALKVAKFPTPVLVQGEHGTGKEILAKIIHELSDRSSKPFIVINCGGLKAELIESELFGHIKGAFTGANEQQKGLIELANHGTLFLDEVNHLGVDTQDKLLRFFQEGEICPVGSAEAIQLDVRVISSTSVDLESAVLQEVFREDFFYCINTISLKIPPLRQRRDELPLFIKHFSQQADSLSAFKLDESAEKVLKQYAWPGNIRELQNLCEKLTILHSDGKIVTAEDLPVEFRAIDNKTKLVQYNPEVSLGQIQKEYILYAVEHFNGNKSHAAKALGVTVKTLYNKLHEYGVFVKFKKYNT